MPFTVDPRATEYGGHVDIPEDSPTRRALRRPIRDTGVAPCATQRGTGGCNINVSVVSSISTAIYCCAIRKTIQRPRENAREGSPTRLGPTVRDTRIDAKSGKASSAQRILVGRQQVRSPAMRKKGPSISQPETTPRSKEWGADIGRCKHEEPGVTWMLLRTIPESGREGGIAVFPINRRRSDSALLDILTSSSVCVEYSRSENTPLPIIIPAAHGPTRSCSVGESATLLTPLSDLRASVAPPNAPMARMGKEPRFADPGAAYLPSIRSTVAIFRKRKNFAHNPKGCGPVLARRYVGEIGWSAQVIDDGMPQHGGYVAVNIDGVAHFVGLYITNACPAIWYDSDGEFDYECALTSIAIGEGGWKVFRVTLPSEIIQGDIPKLYTNLSGRGERVTSVNKIPPEARGRKIRGMGERSRRSRKKDQATADSDIEHVSDQGGCGCVGVGVWGVRRRD